MVVWAGEGRDERGVLRRVSVRQRRRTGLASQETWSRGTRVIKGTGHTPHRYTTLPLLWLTAGYSWWQTALTPRDRAERPPEVATCASVCSCECGVFPCRTHECGVYKETGSRLGKQ